MYYNFSIIPVTPWSKYLHHATFPKQTNAWFVYYNYNYVLHNYNYHGLEGYMCYKPGDKEVLQKYHGVVSAKTS